MVDHTIEDATEQVLRNIPKNRPYPASLNFTFSAEVCDHKEML